MSAQPATIDLQTLRRFLRAVRDLLASEVRHRAFALLLLLLAFALSVLMTAPCQPADWPHSSFHRYVARGLYPAGWAGGSGDPEETGERRRDQNGPIGSI